MAEINPVLFTSSSWKATYKFLPDAIIAFLIYSNSLLATVICDFYSGKRLYIILFGIIFNTDYD